MAGTEHRILIIDDDPQFPVMLQTMLHHGGYVHVDTATLGLAGLAKIQADEADIVFLDLSLPDIDGITLLRRISEQDKGIPIIVVSGSIAQETIKRALAAGASAYLKKPFRKAEVLEVLEQALARIDEDEPGF